MTPHETAFRPPRLSLEDRGSGWFLRFPIDEIGEECIQCSPIHLHALLQGQRYQLDRAQSRIDMWTDDADVVVEATCDATVRRYRLPKEVLEELLPTASEGTQRRAPLA